MNLDQIVALFLQRGFRVTVQQKDQIQIYLKLLKEWNENIHLISKGDVPFLEERHIFPSFVFAEFIKTKCREKNKQIVDLGTGGGLPGLILSILFPESTVWLVDSSRKKTLFLRKVKNELGLNCVVVNERFENWVEVQKQKIDVITARAVASLGDLIKLTENILKSQKAFLLTMKSCQLNDELPDQVKSDFNIQIIENEFLRYSDYMQNKCLVKVEFLHG